MPTRVVESDEVGGEAGNRRRLTQCAKTPRICRTIETTEQAERLELGTFPKPSLEANEHAIDRFRAGHPFQRRSGTGAVARMLVQIDTKQRDGQCMRTEATREIFQFRIGADDARGAQQCAAPPRD